MPRAAATPELLRQHNLFRTTELDEARDRIARIFCPHHLSTTDKSGRLDTVHNRVSMNRLAVNYMDYGAEVEIKPGTLNSFFLVQMPLSGGSQVSYGKASIRSTSKVAAVVSATEPLSMVWHDDSPHLVLHIPRVVIEGHLQQMLGSALTAPLRFELGMDLTRPDAASWRRLVDLAVSDVEHAGMSMNDNVSRQLEDLILTGLLTVQRHNYSDPLQRHFRPTPPLVIQRALALFEERPDHLPTVSELAAAAGISVRSLQVGFQQHVGMTPTAYLRDLRLQRARSDLLQARGTHLSVADVAYTWGFHHLGRFSMTYYKRFGELPSQTLRG